MDGWLEDARAKLAAEVGDEASSYDLSRSQVEELLELARIAAHESGERTNAPLLCYLAGFAAGRGVPLDVAADAVRRDVS